MNISKDKINDWIEDNFNNEEILIADGFEDAFLGIAYQFNTPIAIYDKNKCIQILCDDGSSYEEALEYFEFNVQGAWVGKTTPAFLENFN
jgi:hypothetical protein